MGQLLSILTPISCQSTLLILDLPNESIYRIFRYLLHEDACRFGLCCSRLYDIYKDYKQIELDFISTANNCKFVEDTISNNRYSYVGGTYTEVIDCPDIRINQYFPTINHGVSLWIYIDNHIFDAVVLYHYFDKVLSKCYYKKARLVYNKIIINVDNYKLHGYQMMIHDNIYVSSSRSHFSPMYGVIMIHYNEGIWDHTLIVYYNHIRIYNSNYEIGRLYTTYNDYDVDMCGGIDLNQLQTCIRDKKVIRLTVYQHIHNADCSDINKTTQIQVINYQAPTNRILYVD